MTFGLENDPAIDASAFAALVSKHAPSATLVETQYVLTPPPPYPTLHEGLPVPE